MDAPAAAGVASVRRVGVSALEIGFVCPDWDHCFEMDRVRLPSKRVVFDTSLVCENKQK